VGVLFPGAAARAKERMFGEPLSEVVWKFGASSSNEKKPSLLRGLSYSPGWTRTNNPPVNSRMLCQLSYRGTVLGAGEL
jgi:hypothetical protein